MVSEVNRDIWWYRGEKPDAICVTTNGFVKKNGAAVMGRGIARQALNQYPGIDLVLGRHIKENGNIPGILYDKNYPHTPIIMSFPVKPVKKFCKSDFELVTHMRGKFKVPGIIPGWACRADLLIIENSCKLLREIAEERGFKKVFLPRPGCGNGELDWDKVRPVLYKILEGSPIEFQIYYL